ncbi:MAG: sugar phosphate isomerase/epimerase family protein [Thermoleophilia bacterium]|nr:sugar phosphate isomerase/epimerase [Gaiellaceae bacterium]MDW8338420.1 sugar phosphate isomerase/epimerase family protein [Thermoleophilia bacterium]
MSASGTERSAGLLRRCGMSQCTTPTLTAPQAARLYADAGFGSIGVWLHKLERPDWTGGFFVPEVELPEALVAETAAGVRESGLAVSHVVLGGFFVTDDEELRQRRVRATVRALDVAEALGARCLIIAPGRLEGRSLAWAHDCAARSLSEVLEARSESSVLLGLEPVIAWQSDYLCSIARALELLERVDHPRLGVFLDNFHLWHNADWDTSFILEEIERAGPRIVGVHVNDGVRGSDERALPGEGEMPVAEFVAAIERSGYEGSYDVEYVYDASRLATDPGMFAPEAVVARCRAGLEKALTGVLA